MRDENHLRRVGLAMTTPTPTPRTELDFAILFHETYERLAPSFGYTTRTDTRKFDAESANGKLMIAVIGEVMGAALAEARAEALEENAKLRAALKEANDTCRSAYQVASRAGKDTDMEAWKFAIQKSLKAQHRVMYPEQYTDERLVRMKESRDE